MPRIPISKKDLLAMTQLHMENCSLTGDHKNCLSVSICLPAFPLFRTVRSLFPTTALPEAQSLFPLASETCLAYICPILSYAGPIPVDLGLDLPSILRRRLAFLSQIVPVHHLPFFAVLPWLCIGPIPPEIVKLTNLQLLILSKNQLTGQYFHNFIQ
jgi:hypothetical protein